MAGAHRRADRRLIPILLMLVAVAGAEESTLRRAGEAAHGDRPPSTPADPPPSESDAQEDGPSPRAAAAACNPIGDLIGGLIGQATVGIFGSGAEHWRGSYAASRWPYADGHPGGLVYFPSEDGPDLPGSAPVRETRLALRVGIDAARIEDDLARAGLDLRLELPFRFTVEGRAMRYHERVPGEDVELDTWGMAATWRLLQFRNAALRVGGGVLGLHDDAGGETGGEAIIAFDVQPVAPLLVSARASAGIIGAADRSELRIEAGAIRGRFEGAIGFERIEIEDVALDGPYLALRTWF